jgi:hypothetical protein
MRAQGRESGLRQRGSHPKADIRVWSGDWDACSAAAQSAATPATTEDHAAWGALPSDQVIAHTNLCWIYQSAPRRRAGVVATKDVDFGSTS